jgi:hypothetical protein
MRHTLIMMFAGLVLALSSGCAPLLWHAGQPCNPNQIMVTAFVDQVEYRANDMPEMWLGVQNNGWIECELSVGTDVQEWLIRAGEDKNSELIWSSADCMVAPSELTVRLEPQKERLTSSLSWDRTRSSSIDCLQVGERPKVESGVDYWLWGEIAGVESDEPTRIRLK